MNFNELNKIVNQISYYFKLNVKLINLDDNQEYTHINSNKQDGYDTDEDLVVEQLFDLPNRKESTSIKTNNSHRESKIPLLQAATGSIDSHRESKINRIHEELDGLNMEQRKLDEIIKSFKNGNFHEQDENINITEEFSRKEQSETNKNINIDKFKEEARKIMRN